MSIITINVFLKYLESGISPDSLESKFTQLRSASLGGKMKNCQDKIGCYPMHCSLPGSSLHGISQARILEWVAISFSSYLILLQPHGLWPARLLCPRQESRSGLPFPSPGDLPDPGIKPRSPVLASRLCHRATHRY